MWQSWDHYNRVFLILDKETEGSHRFLSERSHLGKADYQLVFKDGVYYSYEIKTEMWRAVITHLHDAFGEARKLQREIQMNKPAPHTLHQIIALILLVGAIIFLAAR